MEISVSPDILKELYENNDLVSNKFTSQHIFACTDTNINNTKILITTNIQTLYEKSASYLLIGVVISIALLLISVLIAYIFSKHLYNPIERLESGMKVIQTGDFNIQLEIKDDNELERLVKCFNIMAQKINLLIKEKYEEELQKKEAQYQFLQAQIHPHFIFNTLQIISSMAIIHKTPDIMTTTNNLAKLIRCSISNNSTTISLKEEIENLTCYLQIQQLRFKNRLQYEIQIDHSLYSVPIVQMTLQPIVENAISHGLKDKTSDAIITIKVYPLNPDIFIEISDNGIGIDEKTLELLTANINAPIHTNQVTDKKESSLYASSPLSGSHHIGLRNINLRLKMYYGTDYGIKIFSKKNIGTTIIAKIGGTLNEKENIIR